MIGEFFFMYLRETVKYHIRDLLTLNMILELTEKETADIRQGLIITMHAENNERSRPFIDRIEGILEKIDEARGLSNNVPEKKALSVKVLGMFVAGFLDPELNGGNMIMVFDIVEHNPDGKTRLSRLMEEDCTIKLSEEQQLQAIELLND